MGAFVHVVFRPDLSFGVLLGILQDSPEFSKDFPEVSLCWSFGLLGYLKRKAPEKIEDAIEREEENIPPNGLSPLWDLPPLTFSQSMRVSPLEHSPQQHLTWVERLCLIGFSESGGLHQSVASHCDRMCTHIDHMAYTYIYMYIYIRYCRSFPFLNAKEPN